MRNAVKNEVPLTEPTLFVLLSLASGPKHGYAIMQEVEKLSGGRVRLSTGTLYGALQRMLEGGWIERVEEGAADTGGRPRKSYALTDRGRTILGAEIDRLESVAALARIIIAGGWA